MTVNVIILPLSTRESAHRGEVPASKWPHQDLGPDFSTTQDCARDLTFCDFSSIWKILELK